MQRQRTPVFASFLVSSLAAAATLLAACGEEPAQPQAAPSRFAYQGTLKVEASCGVTCQRVSKVSVTGSEATRWPFHEARRSGDLCGHMAFHGAVTRPDGKQRPRSLTLRLRGRRVCTVAIPQDFGQRVQCGDDPECTAVVSQAE